MAIDILVRRLPAGDRYEITLRFKGEHDGRSLLTLPSQWAAATRAERGIEHLEVVTPGARLEETDDPHVKRVLHRPDAPVTVRYRLKQIASGEPSIQRETPYLPILQPTYFEWIGWTAWIVPYANDRPVHATLAFTSLPSRWSFASSLGLNADAIVYDGWIAGLRSAIFVGGDFRLRSRPLTGGLVITAVRGDWPSRDSDFADRVAGIVADERAFWRDDKQPTFLVTLMPLKPGNGPSSITGTGLTDSFATFVPEGRRIDDLDALWTHEYFHTWNNARLGQFRSPQATMYWLSEGFTEYYTNLLMLRRGSRTLGEFIDTIDTFHRKLAESPDRDLPNADIPARFFTSGTAGQLPYQRGMLLAARWDAAIRAHSQGRKSLDDAMRELLAERRRGVFHLDAPRVVRVMNAFGVADAAEDIARQIDRGELPVWTADALPGCVVVDDITTRRYDPGFDLDASISGDAIVGVDADGPAYAAGVRNGQLLASATAPNRADRPFLIGIKEHKSEPTRTFSYLPAGAFMTRQRLRLKDGATADELADCNAAFGLVAHAAVPSGPHLPIRR